MNLFLFFFIFFLIGCEDDHSNYFPLNKIKSWNYNVKIIPEIDETKEYKKTNLSLGEKKILINDKSIKIFPVLKEDGTIFYYQITKNGVFRNGFKFAKDLQINQEKKRIVIPYPVNVGDKWKVDSKTFLILKRYPYYDYRATTDFVVNYKVVSINETIKTPLGKINKCLKIVGNGKTSFIGDSEIGSIQIEVSSEEWYAKDIGLVKTVRIEKTNTDLFGTTKMIQVLENYSKR